MYFDYNLVVFTHFSHFTFAWIILTHVAMFDSSCMVIAISVYSVVFTMHVATYSYTSVDFLHQVSIHIVATVSYVLSYTYTDYSTDHHPLALYIYIFVLYN